MVIVWITVCRDCVYMQINLYHECTPKGAVHILSMNDDDRDETPFVV